MTDLQTLPDGGDPALAVGGERPVGGLVLVAELLAVGYGVVPVLALAGDLLLQAPTVPRAVPPVGAAHSTA